MPSGHLLPEWRAGGVVSWWLWALLGVGLFAESMAGLDQHVRAALLVVELLAYMSEMGATGPSPATCMPAMSDCAVAPRLQLIAAQTVIHSCVRIAVVVVRVASCKRESRCTETIWHSVHPVSVELGAAPWVPVVRCKQSVGSTRVAVRPHGARESALPSSWGEDGAKRDRNLIQASAATTRRLARDRGGLTPAYMSSVVQVRSCQCPVVNHVGLRTSSSQRQCSSATLQLAAALTSLALGPITVRPCR